MAKGYSKIHEEAMKAVGRTPQQEADLWLGYYAYRDYLDWQILIKELGPEKGYKIYEKIWQSIAEDALHELMHSLGIKQVKDMKDVEKLSRAYWEAITVPYEVEKTTEKEHYGKILACPFAEYLRDTYGDDKLLEFGKNALAPCSINYYVMVAEKLKKDGLVDPKIKIAADMDKFICAGDEFCRVRWWKE